VDCDFEVGEVERAGNEGEFGSRMVATNEHLARL